MRKVFVLMHSGGAYSGTAKPLRAFEEQAAAAEMAETLKGVVKYEIEIVEIVLEESPKAPAAARVPIPSLVPAAHVFGAAQGRAELP